MERTTDETGAVTGAALHGSKIGGDVEGAHLIFPDPMGATGSSLSKVISHYRSEVGGTPEHPDHERQHPREVSLGPRRGRGYEPQVDARVRRHLGPWIAPDVRDHVHMRAQLVRE